VSLVLEDAVDQARAFVEQDGTGYRFERQAGREIRPVVLSGLMRKVLEQAGVPGDKMTARQVERLVDAVSDHEGGERVFSFAGNTQVIVTRDGVTIGPG